MLSIAPVGRRDGWELERGTRYTGPDPRNDELEFKASARCALAQTHRTRTSHLRGQRPRFKRQRRMVLGTGAGDHDRSRYFSQKDVLGARPLPSCIDPANTSDRNFSSSTTPCHRHNSDVTNHVPAEIRTTAKSQRSPQPTDSNGGASYLIRQGRQSQSRILSRSRNLYIRTTRPCK